MERLLTVRETSAVLNIHCQTIYRLVAGGELPVIRKRGMGIRFRREDLEAWIGQGKQQNHANISYSDIIPKASLTVPSRRDKNVLGGSSEMAKAKTKSRIIFGYGAVYQRKTKEGKPRWYLDYRDGSGKRHQELVPFAITAEEAKVALDREVRQVFDHDYAIIRERSNERFEDFTKLYIDNYARVMKRSWQRSDLSYLRAHLNPVFGKMPLSEITKFQIEQYIAKRQDDAVERRPSEKVKKTTINREVACMRKILNKAVDWGYLAKSPMNGVRLFSEKDNLKERILSRDEEKRLLQACPRHLRSISLFALHTGMRRGEIFSLKWPHVDLGTKMIKVVMTKSGRTRLVCVNDVLLEMLRELRKSSPADNYVFVNPKTGKPYTDVKTSFSTACKRAGIKNLRFHDFRHTFASRLVENGTDLITVKELLGHSTVKTTERYTHSNQEQKRRAVDTLVPFKARENGQNGEEPLHVGDTDSAKQAKPLPIPLFSVN
jgi:excisionase family DNA binding protein